MAIRMIIDDTGSFGYNEGFPDEWGGIWADSLGDGGHFGVLPVFRIAISNILIQVDEYDN